MFGDFFCSENASAKKIGMSRYYDIQYIILSFQASPPMFRVPCAIRDDVLRFICLNCDGKSIRSDNLAVRVVPV